MLAFGYFSLAGCSDDVIEGLDNKQENQEVKGTGYFAVSFSAGTNSSRGVTDNANGDQHPNAEDNGHHNAGVTGESTVNSILVVLKGNNNEHYAYFDTADKIAAAFDNKTNGNDYIMQKPLLVGLDIYKVLVVVNPTSSIVTNLTNTDNQLNGEEKLGTNKSLYDNICKMEISADADEGFDNAVGKIISKSESPVATVNPKETEANFMMCNQEEVANVRVDATNTVDNPAQADVNVERVISKITFRSGYRTAEGTLTDADQTAIKSIEGESETTNFSYWYKVPFKQFTKKQVQVSAKLNSTETDFAEYSYQTTENGTQKTVSVYKNLDNLTDSNWYSITGTGTEAAATVETLPNGVTPTAVGEYETDANGNVVYTEETWYVKLTDYALINLSNKVYAVRHIGTDSYSDDGGVSVMGKLNDTNKYLVDPWSTAKNGLNVNEANWETATTNWFYQPWAAVAAQTKSTEEQSFFKPFSAVTADQGKADTAHDGISDVGNLLSYCFENAVKADHQVLGLSTGIVFKATMYAPNTDGTWGKADKPLFSYKGVAYKSLSGMKELLGSNVVKDVEGVTSKEVKDWTSTDIAAFEAANPNISVYKAGACYYYTSQIKHYDDGDNTDADVMEFAIMRNNIYSLAISEIAQIGDATLDVLEPSTPDEEPTANILVHARILPWVVRFTNINF